MAETPKKEKESQKGYFKNRINAYITENSGKIEYLENKVKKIEKIKQEDIEKAYLIKQNIEIAKNYLYHSNKNSGATLSLLDYNSNVPKDLGIRERLNGLNELFMRMKYSNWGIYQIIGYENISMIGSYEIDIKIAIEKRTLNEKRYENFMKIPEKPELLKHFRKIKNIIKKDKELINY
jgi:hypothetical protein